MNLTHPKSRKTIFTGIALIPSLLALTAASALAETRLSLSDYLNQVESGNPAARASAEGAQAAKEKSDEASLLTMPQFFASAQSGVDKKKGLFFAYDSVSSDMYTVGLQQQTSFGLSAKVSYTLTNMEYVGLPAQFLMSNPVLGGPFSEGLPKLELTQSFWKNAFGAETRAQVAQIRAGTEAQRQGELLKHKMSRIEAEIAYWRLSLAREARDIAAETLERAKKLANWSERRASQGLADRSDALQGSSAVRLRELQFQAAKDEERAARLAFNSSRGVAGDTVSEEVEALTEATLQSLTSRKAGVAGTAPVREDLKAAEQQMKLAEAASELGRSRNAPTLDLFASAALNSRDADTGTALSDSFGTEQPTYGGGIRFVLPLDIGAWSSARAGYERDRQAAELSYERRKFENDQEWTDLNLKLAESLQRLEITRRLESTQKEKSDYERSRYDRGRSTTYQVLNFEEDYAQARLNRLRNQFEALTLGARLKTFENTAADAEQGVQQ